jgi:signal transduction histidine kinase
MGENEDQFFNAIIIIAILIGIVLVYFIITIIRYHRRYINLQKERIFAEITIQENERKRIASDLHDSLGPLLSTVKLNINSIEIHGESDQEIVNKAGKHIDEIITSLRRISYNLLPNTLQRSGLTEAVKEFIKHMQDKNSVQIHFYLIKAISVQKEKEVHIFRMLQEIIHNTIKHAKAKNLHISISEENGNLLVLAKDDGLGFDIQKIKSPGLGLKSLDSRIEILKGQLSVESFPQKGTSYFFKIPL